jgi:hypothetical protein
MLPVAISIQIYKSDVGFNLILTLVKYLTFVNNMLFFVVENTLLAIVFSVLLRLWLLITPLVSSIMASDYPFGILD